MAASAAARWMAHASSILRIEVPSIRPDHLRLAGPTRESSQKPPSSGAGRPMTHLTQLRLRRAASYLTKKKNVRRPFPVSADEPVCSEAGVFRLASGHGPRMG